MRELLQEFIAEYRYDAFIMFVTFVVRQNIWMLISSRHIIGCYVLDNS